MFINCFFFSKLQRERKTDSRVEKRCGMKSKHSRKSFLSFTIEMGTFVFTHIFHQVPNLNSFFLFNARSFLTEKSSFLLLSFRVCVSAYFSVIIANIALILNYVYCVHGIYSLHHIHKNNFFPINLISQQQRGALENDEQLFFFRGGNRMGKTCEKNDSIRVHPK